jgi:hypothetical protein
VFTELAYTTRACNMLPASVLGQSVGQMRGQPLAAASKLRKEKKDCPAPSLYGFVVPVQWTATQLGK